MTMPAIQILNAKLGMDANHYDIALADQKIHSITKSEDRSKARQYTSPEMYDARGNLVLPAMIDMHCHIDKTYSGIENEDGTLLGAIQSMARYKLTRNRKMVRENAERAIKQSIKYGVQRLRSHVDISGPEELDILSDLLSLKERYKNIIVLDFIAMGSFDTEVQKSYMHNAMEMGASMVGGVPALSENPHKAIENAFACAQRFGTGLDLHIDETESTDVITLELLADLSIKNEFRHPVYASHCCNLAFLNQEKLDELIEKLLIANISIVSLPTCNLFLQGRNMSPVPRGVAPLKQLIAAGVNVCVGSDNVHDPFNPFGSYDLLKSLHIACLAAQIGTPDELFHATNLVIRNPARALGDPNNSVCVGNDANLFITDKSTISECVIDTPKRLACFHKGKLVFQQSINETLIDV